MERLSNNELNLTYEMNSKDAQKYADDFLEGYKANYGHIGYGIGRLHDNSDEILNISLRKKPTLFQKATGRLGNATDEINIHRSDHVSIKGNATGFVMTLSNGKQIEFSDNGVYSK